MNRQQAKEIALPVLARLQAKCSVLVCYTRWADQVGQAEMAMATDLARQMDAALRETILEVLRTVPAAGVAIVHDSVLVTVENNEQARRLGQIVGPSK
jgi:hypothetical protein